MTHHRDVVIPQADRYCLRRARVPACFLKTPVPSVKADADGSVFVDIVIAGGKVASIAPAAMKPPADMPVVDIEGRMVWATLVDMHAHLDKGQNIYRIPPTGGTLAGGAAGTIADRKRWTSEDIARRMRFGVRCGYAHGVSTIRTHIDSQPDIAERSWAVLREVRAEWAGRLDLQAVALGPMTMFESEWGEKLADLTAESGGILGGSTDAIYNYSATAYDKIDALLDKFLGLAEARSLDVDLHVDQTDDINVFWLPRIAEAVIRNKFKGKVVCDHCVNLALQPDDVIRRTIDLCAEAGLMLVTLPTPMMFLQDRQPGRTPRWRGVTLAKELHAAGVPLAIGGDNCRDAWFPFGDHDMVDTFQQSVRVFQLDDPLTDAVAMAGPIPAAIIGAAGIGTIAVGQPAKMILFSARNLNELMCRPQTDRIVLDAGKRVVEPLPEFSELDPDEAALSPGLQEVSA